MHFSISIYTQLCAPLIKAWRISAGVGLTQLSFPLSLFPKVNLHFLKGSLLAHHAPAGGFPQCPALVYQDAEELPTAVFCFQIMLISDSLFSRREKKVQLYLLHLPQAAQQRSTVLQGTAKGLSCNRGRVVSNPPALLSYILSWIQLSTSEELIQTGISPTCKINPATIKGLLTW